MNIINLYDYAKEGFNWELLIAFADFVISSGNNTFYPGVGNA